MLGLSSIFLFNFFLHVFCNSTKTSANSSAVQYAIRQSVRIISIVSMQCKAIPYNKRVYHAIPYNTRQYYAIICTMQYVGNIFGWYFNKRKGSCCPIKEIPFLLDFSECNLKHFMQIPFIHQTFLIFHILKVANGLQGH